MYLEAFTKPEIAEVVSPLSPKAFSYYRFEYLGSFKDQNLRDLREITQPV